jgi:hypothetical protein
MRALRLARAIALLAVITVWHWVLARFSPDSETAEQSNTAGEGEETDPDLVEHERNWYDYVRGFHAHHGAIEGDHPEHGSFREGLLWWQESNYLRGYTLGDDVYLCPNAPRVLRVHQAGHASSFGREFEPLWTERRDDGGLNDEPLWTFDVMLPGGFPHTFVRLRDHRGLGEAYEEWLEEGRIVRR